MYDSLVNDFEPYLNTIRASRWELFKARLFGIAIIRTERFGVKIILSEYKGKIYFMEEVDG